jgi:FdhD protein
MPQYKVVNGVKVAIDVSVKIYVNGRLAAELVTNPEDLEDLAVGYLYSEGYINALDDIVEVKVDGDAIHAKLKRDVRVVGRRLEDCGVGSLVKSLAGKSSVSPKVMIELAREFSKLTIWQVDPHLAMHTSALYLDGEWLVVHDTSRHSGVVKLVGKYIRRNPARLRLAYTTGRASSDMIYRLATIGVDGIVSLRGPLHSGVEAACKLGIPLVANVRNLGFMVLCDGHDFRKTLE